MTCSGFFPAYEATSWQLEKAKGSPLSGQIRNMCPIGGTGSLMDTEAGCAGLLPLQSPSVGAFCSSECTPMETALASLTVSGNMTLVDELGSRSAELAQPQQVPPSGNSVPLLSPKHSPLSSMSLLPGDFPPRALVFEGLHVIPWHPVLPFGSLRILLQ